MVFAWENLQRFLWCWSSFCCYSLFVNVFHSHFLFDIMPHPSVDYRQVFRPILYFQPSPSQSDSRHFHFFNYSIIFLLRVLGFWVGIFYPQAFFTLHSFLTFWHNLLLSRFHWEPAVTFLKVAGLHTDPQNTDPAHLFVWFTVIHNLLYILNLYSSMSILQKFYLW